MAVTTCLGVYLGSFVSGTGFGTDSGGTSSRSPTKADGHEPYASDDPKVLVDRARKFDATLDLEEWFQGIKSLRRRITAKARGHVLETAVGTGRNFWYYDWDGIRTGAEETAAREGESEGDGGGSKIGNTFRAGDGKMKKRMRMESFTGIDIKPEMLGVAMEKLDLAIPDMTRGSLSMWEALGSGQGQDQERRGVQYLSGRIRLLKADAQEPAPPPPTASTKTGVAKTTIPATDGDGKYDTIIQTFGLCSLPDPARVLAAMAQAVKPGTGRIFLLEHGRGWGVLDGILDRNAPKHFEKYGCWYNKDIEGIVRETAERIPGLEVARVERPKILQMGTLIWIELRVKRQGGRVGGHTGEESL